jgi:hypothetical protein
MAPRRDHLLWVRLSRVIRGMGRSLASCQRCRTATDLGIVADKRRRIIAATTSSRDLAAIGGRHREWLLRNPSEPRHRRGCSCDSCDVAAAVDRHHGNDHRRDNQQPRPRPPRSGRLLPATVIRRAPLAPQGASCREGPLAVPRKLQARPTSPKTIRFGPLPLLLMVSILTSLAPGGSLPRTTVQ